MNYNLCATCSDPVHVMDVCSRPECIIAAAYDLERQEAVKRGKFAYKNYAQFTDDPKEWNDLSPFTRERWISAVESTREERAS